MSDPTGPAKPEEPSAPQFGAPQPDAAQHAPAAGEPAQPFSSPAPGAVPPATEPPAAPQFGAPGQQPPAAPPYGAPGGQVPPQQPSGAPQPGQPGPGAYGAGHPGPGQYGAPGQPQYAADAPMTPQDEKQWAMLGHLGGIAWILYLGWLGPLIVFLMYKDRSAFVRQESKEALNFQLFMTILTVGGTIVISILTAITFGIAGLLYFLVGVPPLLGIIFAIIGAVRVNGGGSYRYPFNWRIIK